MATSVTSLADNILTVYLHNNFNRKCNKMQKMFMRNYALPVIPFTVLNDAYYLLLQVYKIFLCVHIFRVSVQVKGDVQGDGSLKTKKVKSNSKLKMPFRFGKKKKGKLLSLDLVEFIALI